MDAGSGSLGPHARPEPEFTLASASSQSPATDTSPASSSQATTGRSGSPKPSVRIDEELQEVIGIHVGVLGVDQPVAVVVPPRAALLCGRVHLGPSVVAVDSRVEPVSVEVDVVVDFETLGRKRWDIEMTSALASFDPRG